MNRPTAAVLAVLCGLAAHVGANGAPRADDPKTCSLDTPAGPASFYLTIRPRVMVMQLDGKAFVLERNDELSTSEWVVAGKATATGRMSFMVDRAGNAQQTILTIGQRPTFIYGKCEI